MDNCPLSIVHCQLSFVNCQHFVMKIFQKGFNYSQDGPGNRLVYHLQGCNMICPWCSNPEGMDVETGKYTPICEIKAEIERSTPMFFDGGGVTLTGGEPTLQLDKIIELYSSLKGVHRAIETNGTHKRLPELFPHLDYLIMDIKHYDSKLHKEYTGIDNQVIRRNLEAAVRYGMPLLVRIPLINGFNAHVSGIPGFLDFFEPFGPMTLELLTYHEYGRDKWTRIGKEYTIKDGSVAPCVLQKFTSAFKKAGINVVTT